MKVQELVDRLADFRADADVVFWHHFSEAGREVVTEVTHVARDNMGYVGINWSEDALPPKSFDREIIDD